MKNATRLAEIGLVACLAATYFGYVFQFSGGVPADGLGDWIDPYFINYLLEHWYVAIRHFANPASPPMYYPEPGTLGYSHGLVLYAPLYAVLRPWLDPFRAETVTAFIVMTAGTVMLFAVLRTFIRTNFLESLALTALVATSANIVNDQTRTWLQRASVFLIPPIVWLMVKATGMRDSWARWLLGGVAAFAGMLVFTQDFYTGAFAILVGGLQFAGELPSLGRRIGAAWMAPPTTAGSVMTSAPGAKPPSIAWLVIAIVAAAWGSVIWLSPIARVEIGPLRFSAENYRRPFLVAVIAASWFVARRWQITHRLWRFARRISPTPFAVASGAGVFLGAAVFAWIYLPVYLEGRTFPIDNILNSSHALNPSEWRGPLDALRSMIPFTTPRPFLLVLFVAFVAAIPYFGVAPAIRRHALWSVVVAAVMIALPLKFGDISVWRTVIGWAPGYSSIRDPGRIIYLYELLVAFAAALFLARLPARSPVRLATAIIVVLLVAADWNRETFAYARPLSTFREWVERPVAIDPSCRSFYIRGASPAYMARSNHMWSLYGMDAMFIALGHGLPTLNGYSAWGPDGWQLANPQESAYRDAVARWIRERQLTGVCELDIEARTMTPTTLVR